MLEFNLHKKLPDTIAHQHFSGQKNDNLMLEYSIRRIMNAN